MREMGYFTCVPLQAKVSHKSINSRLSKRVSETNGARCTMSAFGKFNFAIKILSCFLFLHRYNWNKTFGYFASRCVFEKVLKLIF